MQDNQNPDNPPLLIPVKETQASDFTITSEELMGDPSKWVTSGVGFITAAAMPPMSFHIGELVIHEKSVTWRGNIIEDAGEVYTALKEALGTFESDYRYLREFWLASEVHRTPTEDKRVHIEAKGRMNVASDFLRAYYNSR